MIEKTVRVLHVIGCMNCGGAENMLMNLYRNIDRSKVQFDFLVHTKKKCFFDEEIKSLGGKIYHIPYYTLRNHIEYKVLLDRFFKDHPEIEIVHGHIGSCAHIYLQIAKKYGKFTIAHSHNTDSTSLSIKNCLYKLFNLKTRKIADYFMACGIQAGKDRFGNKIVQSDRFMVLNNAIDAKKYIYNELIREKVRKELGINGSFVVGHIGRFTYQKNHDFLIDVFIEICRRKNNAVLLLVGDGELRQEITNKVKQHGLDDKVIFMGVRSDVPELLQAMDCFVFPSHFEGLGIVAVEAQAAGLPTICSDVVPKEAIVSDLMIPISLSKGCGYWADTILSEKINRCNQYDNICNNNYDIKSTSESLVKYYLEKKNDS